MCVCVCVCVCVRERERKIWRMVENNRTKMAPCRWDTKCCDVCSALGGLSGSCVCFCWSDRRILIGWKVLLCCISNQSPEPQMSCDTLYLSHVYEQTKNIDGKQFYYNVIHYGYFYFAFNTMYFFKICPYFYLAVNGKLCYIRRFIYTDKYQFLVKKQFFIFLFHI